MITGAVRSDEGRILLKVIGDHGREQQVEAIIDTGYNGALTLPPAVIAKLGLRWQSAEWATLADGSICVCQVYVGKLIWDGKVRAILVDEADAASLVGMRLLRLHELRMQVRAGGKVTIKRLPPKSAATA